MTVWVIFFDAYPEHYVGKIFKTEESAQRYYNENIKKEDHSCMYEPEEYEVVEE